MVGTSRSTRRSVVAVALGGLFAACSGTTGGDGRSSGGAGGSGGSSVTDASSGGTSGVGAGGSAATGGGGSGGSLALDGDIHDQATQDGDACGSFHLEASTTPGNVVVVFDQSNSMGQPFDQTDSGVPIPKWTVARDALSAAVTPLAVQLNVGAIFFPTAPPALFGGCSPVPTIQSPPQIPLQPGTQFVGSLAGHFTGSWSLIRSTPLKRALDNAVLAFPEPSPFPGARILVVMTDGAPTCEKVEADLLAPIQSLFARGIKTYIVGLPGSTNASTLMNDLAAAGGTVQYSTPADPTALQQTLASIATTAIDHCTFTFNPPPPDTTQVHLIVSDSSQPGPYEVPLGAGSWTLAPDGSSATLEGAVCDRAKAGGYATLEFVFGCPFGPT